MSKQSKWPCCWPGSKALRQPVRLNELYPARQVAKTPDTANHKLPTKTPGTKLPTKTLGTKLPTKTPGTKLPTKTPGTALPNKPRVPYSTGKLVYTAIPRNHGFSLAAALGEPSQMHDPFEKQLVGLCQDEADRAAVKADKVKKRGQPAAAKCRKADENDSPRPDNVPAKRRRKRVAKKGSDMDGVNSP